VTLLGILSGLRDSIAFLTILPVGMDRDGFHEAAKYMPLFPIVGALIGLLAGAFAWAIFPILPPLIVGLLCLGSILLITGVHHTDGLLDFGDAVMYHGSRAEKIRVMHDPTTGAGAVSLGLVVLVTTGLSIAELNRPLIIPALVASEAVAKFAMALQAWAGKSAHDGMNTPFIRSMHEKKWRPLRLAVAFVLALSISVIALQTVGVAVVAAAASVAMLLLVIATRQFGGVTGDVMGATNDITRLGSLIVILGLIRWV
jgi:adenosylcobinamide-GDP ribazoletransferase